MKVSDYIVQTLKNHGICHYYGYQGTMIAHFADSIGRDSDVVNHSCYNEQAAAFAACGHAKITGKCAVAYSTSGPGAINLLSGIADAYYDSAPVLFITGQINTYEYTGIEELRQQSFQETDIISMARPVTKYAKRIESIKDVPDILETALRLAEEGRKGPVLLDIPMNIQRSQLDAIPFKKKRYEGEESDAEDVAKAIMKAIHAAERPLLLLGNGMGKSVASRKKIRESINKLQIPVVTSMLARDLLDSDNPLNYGYIGSAYGHRYANLIAYKKADLIVSLGCSMCRRQTGMNTEEFAKQAQIIRVDIDPAELCRRVHKEETHFVADANRVIAFMGDMQCEKKTRWLEVCDEIRDKLKPIDALSDYYFPNQYMETISRFADKSAVFVCDVGQHQVWGAQSLNVCKEQRILFSGGHGAMGFALPASIGAHYATGKRTYAICGDGAFQMNIQELQWIVRENLDVTMVVMNNHALGLIEQQQDDFFDGLHYGSTEWGGFSSPSFARIAEAYGIDSCAVNSTEMLEKAIQTRDKQGPFLIEIDMPNGTKAYPKTYFGEEMYNQRPYVDSVVLKGLMAL